MQLKQGAGNARMSFLLNAACLASMSPTKHLYHLLQVYTAYKTFPMQSLTQPDTSTDITRGGTVIGQVKCININPPSMPPAIRWYGQRPNGMPSGHARETQAEAAQDVADWADGKDVAYVKHVELTQGAGACSRLVKLSIGSKELPLQSPDRIAP
jgi:hypothetical protein